MHSSTRELHAQSRRHDVPSHTHKCTEYKPGGIPPRTKMDSASYQDCKTSACYPSAAQSEMLLHYSQLDSGSYTKVDPLRPNDSDDSPHSAINYGNSSDAGGARRGARQLDRRTRAERGQNAGPSSRARSQRAGGAARCGCLAGDDQSASLKRHGVFCDNPFFCWRLRNHRARPRHRRHAVTRRPSMVVPSVTWRPGVTRRPAVTRRPRQWADQVLRRRPKQRVNQF